jgi:hypothetical protein
MPRTGEIGEQIYNQVEQLVSTGMNRTEAFARISQESGRRAGTVAANYYRVARKRAGGSLRARRPRAAARGRAAAATAAPTRRRGRRPAAAAAAGGDIDRIAADLVSNVEALAKVVKDQSKELSELRSRLDGVRQLLS